MGPLLNHERVTAAGGTPGRWLYILHGIYGAGRNWGTVARQLVTRRADWGVVLVDLRQHGASQGFAPPHTIAAAAADLHALGDAGGPGPAAVLGHSFGGKVALAFSLDAPPGLAQVWVIDSTPSARSPAGSAWQMLEAVRALPARFAARDEAADALVARGFDPPVARWMTTNLERTADGLRWRFDLDAIQALLEDFFRTDLWHALEPPPDDITAHVVKADASSVLTPDDQHRLRAAGERVHLHTVRSGHWVNADNPEALLELLADRLPGVDPAAGAA